MFCGLWKVKRWLSQGLLMRPPADVNKGQGSNSSLGESGLLLCCALNVRTVFIIQWKQSCDQAQIYTVSTLWCFEFFFVKPSVHVRYDYYRILNSNLTDRIYSLFHSDDISAHNNTHITLPSALFGGESKYQLCQNYIYIYIIIRYIDIFSVCWSTTFLPHHRYMRQPLLPLNLWWQFGEWTLDKLSEHIQLVCVHACVRASLLSVFRDLYSFYHWHW